MYVVQLPVQRPTNVGQRQIVCTDEPDSTAIQQRTDDALGPDTAII